jgi:hypothetical protein
MVQADGSSSRGNVLHVRGRSEHRSSSDKNDRNKNNDGRGYSQSKGPKKKICKYYKKKSHMIEDCWKLQNKEKRKNKSDGKASVASAAENSESDCLVVFFGCAAGHDEWILNSVCSFQICTNRDWFSSYEPCIMEILCVWKMITHVRLCASALFRSRPLTA